MDFQKIIKLMYWIIIYLMILTILSCSEWQAFDVKRLLAHKPLTIFLKPDDSISAVRHHLDSGRIEFSIKNFSYKRMEEFDSIAMDQGWCIINKLRDDKTYVSEHTESFINAQIINIMYNNDTNEAFIVLSH